jgi:two-component system, response regulator YesN
MYRIMIVDDEKMVIESIKGKINWNDLNACLVGEACNGAEALQKIPQCFPNILIVDMRMPIMDGLELIDRLRQSNSAVKVIITSAYTDFEYTKKAICIGAVDYLVKPVKKEELNQAILNAIHKIKVNRFEVTEILSRMIKNEVNPDEAELLLEQLQSLDNHWGGNAYGLIVIKHYNHNIQPFQPILAKELTKDIAALKSNHGISHFQVFINRDVLNELDVLICFHSYLPDDNNQSLKELTRSLFTGDYGEKYQISIGIGPLRRELFELKSMYQEATYTVKGLKPVRRLIYEARQYLDENFSREIKLKDLAQKYFVSEEYLSRLFKEELGEGFSEYLTRIRLEKAMEYLGEPRVTISQISSLVGYTDTKYFFRIFKKKFNLTPSEVRKQLGEKV